MKLLVVGLGSIGQRHVRCLRKLCGDDLELVAFRTRGLDRAISDQLEASEGVSLEELYGIRTLTRLDDALAEGPTAALVCTPNHLHVPLATRLASAGLHLFLEKPVSHSLEGLDDLQHVLDDKQRICCVGYHLRFHPGIQRMIAIVRAGDLGVCTAAQFDFGEYLPYWHRYEDYSKSFMARESEGGGVTLTQIHDLDVAYATFGLPNHVFATGGSSGTLEMDAEDHVTALLSYEGESAFGVAVTQDCLRYPPRRSYVVHGTRGSLEFDYAANRLVQTPFEGSARVVYADPRLERSALFLEQMRHFLACLRGDERPQVDLFEGTQSLRLALSIKESLSCRQPVAPSKLKFLL